MSVGPNRQLICTPNFPLLLCNFFQSLLLADIHLSAAPLSNSTSLLFFSLNNLVFVVLIRLSLPEGPREQPQQSTAWKDRTHNPCYEGGCHLACRSTNSFNTMGAIVYLNIDFPPQDTISYIPTSISLALAKRLHLLEGNAMCACTPPSFTNSRMRRCFMGRVREWANMDVAS